MTSHERSPWTAQSRRPFGPRPCPARIGVSSPVPGDRELRAGPGGPHRGHPVQDAPTVRTAPIHATPATLRFRGTTRWWLPGVPADQAVRQSAKLAAAAGLRGGVRTGRERTALPYAPVWGL